jgi:GWxTD domain-containing protein
MSQLARWVHTPFALALGWTLVHFIWEGAALAALLMVALRLFRAAPAERRYALACLILAAMPLAFAATLGLIWWQHPAPMAAPLRWSPPAALSAATPEPSRLPGEGIFDRLAWAVPVWFVGVAFFYLRGVAGWLAVERLRRRGVCAPPPAWQARLAELAAAMRLSRPVALLESCFTDTPVLIGWLRPVVLVPLGCLTGLPAGQVECILLHELAHAARHDYAVNLLQSVVEGLLFYHPAVWWASRVVRAERENCCDDRVVDLMGDARSYAAALATLEQRRALAPRAALAATGGSLMKRIRRLTGAQTPAAPPVSAGQLPAIFAALLAAVAGVALAAAPQGNAQAMAPVYVKWLHEDAAYIITDAERAQFRQLSTDAERDTFIENFWLRRDPTPGTAENEFKEEHYRRIAYANEHFAAAIPGWKTDRGRIYITYGPPDEIDDHSSGGSYQRPPEEGGGKTSTFPFQQWRYRYIEGIGTNIIVEFVDPDRSGEFHMTMDPSEKDALLYVPNAGPYRKWLTEDAAYIIADEERAAFQRLATDAEREAFIESFWQRRGSAFKDEHYRRIAYANQHFTTVRTPGWKTDPGRIYITYGPPDLIWQSFETRALVVWTYRHPQGIGNDTKVVFAELDGELHLAREPGAPPGPPKLE